MSSANMADLAASEPIYDLQPGKQLTLYQGPVTLMSGSERDVGSGTVTFDWYAGTRLDLTVEEPASFVSGRDYEVSLEGVDIRGTQIGINSNTSHSAEDGATVHTATIALGQAVRGRIDMPITHVVVHLCNVPPGFFREPDPARLIIEADDWRVSIHEAPDSKDRYASVRRDRGGAVTHIVQLERSDGSRFIHDDASEVLEAFRHLINFAFGRRVAFLLPVGISADGDRAFEIWGDPRRHLHTGGIPWFTGHRSDALSSLWPLFLEKWKDPTWRDGLMVANELYVDAHDGPPLETRLLIAQAALELLSWQWLTRNTNDSHSGLRGLSAARRLARTLDGMGVPTEIPEELRSLSDFYPKLSGPEVLTRLRNKLAHPTRPDEILKVPNQAKFDAVRLALWYFDLIIFRVCGFTGQYLNRTRPLPIWDGSTELPPWHSV